MIGIAAYSVYVPLWRLSRDKLADGVSGEKAVANFDEDSITMAVAAAIDCLKGTNRQTIDGLFFASTSSPYKEKQACSVVAAAADLRQDIITADFANCLRSGTTALRTAIDVIKAGSAKQVLVVASDCRLGTPGSLIEQNCGDGAVALLISNSETAVTLKSSHSVSDEIMDMWRADGDTFIRTSEDRFAQEEGYLRVMREAVAQLMQGAALEPKDFASFACYAPDRRRLLELARSLGFDVKTQLTDSLLDTVGNTGAALPLMSLAAALEKANAGDYILLASYGDGSDVFLLEAGDRIAQIREGKLKKSLETKKMIPDYATYLQWRGLLKKEPMPQPPPVPPAPTAMWRGRNRNIRFYGAKCSRCDTIQYPPQRVCTNCYTQDQFEDIRLAEVRGEVNTFSMNNRPTTAETAEVVTVVNFNGGGRITCLMTDRDIEEVRIGLPVEMTFRKLASAEGIHNYFWKSKPSRS